MRRRQFAARPREQIVALLKAFRAAHPRADIQTIERAYTVAAHAHRGQLRKSGDPYISHPVAVAMIVTEFGMSPDVVCAALLHDTIEHDATHAYTLAQLREEFGEQISALVDGMSELDKSGHAEEKLRRVEAMLKLNTDSAAMLQSPEVGVLVLKLADRLHNMRTLRYLSPGKQQRKSRETLQVHVPLARLLGMETIKRELDDLASAILYPSLGDEQTHTVSERALAAAVVLLPSAARARWLHEWTAELSVLPTRRARARFALQMLRGVPRLAVVLRQK
ncbi:MAG: HD domain-containing protein [Pseudonocardiales bacterium]